MKRFIIGVSVLLTVLTSFVSYAKNMNDDMILNSLKSNIDHYEIMIRPTIKYLSDFTKTTNDVKKQRSTMDAIRPVQNFQNICSHIGYILSTKDFIDPSKLDEYYKFITRTLPHFYQDLRIEYEDLNRKSLLFKDKALINIFNRAQHTMMITLIDIRNNMRILKNPN